MWKLIIKNLWSRRKRNGWLFAELVLVSIVTWVVLDPVLVLSYDRSLPLGYDADRLCLIDVAFRNPQSPLYDSEATDSASVADGYFRLLEQVRNHPEVEQAAPILSFAYLNADGLSNSRIMTDTLKRGIAYVWFLPGQHFFETYGIRAIEGSASEEELSKAAYGPNDWVVTRNLVENQLKDRPISRLSVYSFASDTQEDTVFYPIRGVMENVRYRSYWRPSPLVFIPDYAISTGTIRRSQAKLLLRLKPGVSHERFLHDFRPWMVKNLRSGNLFGRAVYSYDKLLKDGAYSSGTDNKWRLNVAMAVFFGISLCLGVIGTFWLQTRKRSEEAGVMRSFGATPSHILRMLLGEGAVLTTLAFLLGCGLYLQYAWKEGFYVGASWQDVDGGYWVSSFGSHFAVVSAVVYLLLLAVVLAGISIPAYGISRVNPVDALRDE